MMEFYGDHHVAVVNTGWKEDYDMCTTWEKCKDQGAKEALRSSERSRLAEQKKFTPVWELRRVPPKDWHMPLNHERPQDS
ncbi:unnamed protein product [Gadus morhua 'NCC']